MVNGYGARGDTMTSLSSKYSAKPSRSSSSAPLPWSRKSPGGLPGVGLLGRRNLCTSAGDAGFMAWSSFRSSLSGRGLSRRIGSYPCDVFEGPDHLPRTGQPALATRFAIDDLPRVQDHIRIHESLEPSHHDDGRGTGHFFKE